MTDFESIYHTYFEDVYLYIRRLSGDEHIAEEITSDTFFKAMNSIDSFRRECDIRVWLCQIAKNCYYSYMKKRSRLQSDVGIADITDPDENVEERMVRRENVKRIQIAMRNIDETYREVFMWRVYAELSFRDIGELFGKSENWACVTYHRARKKIMEEMGNDRHGE